MSRSFRSHALPCAFAAFALSACSGGGGSLPSAPAAPGTNSGNNGATISSVLGSIMAPASTSQVKVLAGAVAPNVDAGDTASTSTSMSASAIASFVSGTKVIASHAYTVNSAGLRSGTAAKRHTSASAGNSPFDVSYFGGPVLGSAISDNVFVNCDVTCRASSHLNPGRLETDLSQDQYVNVLYQYLASPGVVVSTPLTGRYTKGDSADVTFTPGAGNAFQGFTNPVLLPSDLLGLLVQGIIATGGLDQSHNRVYHLFLPPNVDTCFDASATRCYSPDNFSAFAFCAYHSFATTQSGFPVYFTVEPDQDTPGCQPLTTLPLPNQVGNNLREDSTDSTLSHELFETISDPQLDAWFQGLQGNEIADLCSSFDNFVTINHDRYIIQSEYSDILHECISANLSSQTLTP